MEDSEQGIELLKKIFALDRVCCNNCDDSDCRLALIFNYELFSVEACLENVIPGKGWMPWNIKEN